MTRRLSLLILTAVLSLASFAQAPSVIEVTILSVWAGYGIPPLRESTVHLLRTASGSYVTDDEVPVNTERIASLMNAISARANTSPKTEDLGLTSKWLTDQFPQVEKKNNEMQTHEGASQRQKELFRETFEDPERLRPVVGQVYHQGRHTDDNPFVEVQIKFEDGTTLIARSRSQQQCMLPWEITRADHKVTAFNRDISRAVVDLLPPDSVNRGRLNGDGLAEALGDATMDYIEDKWNLIGAEEKAGPALSALRSGYDLQTAEIAGYYEVTFGKEWKDGQSQQTNLIATVRSGSYPKNFNQRVVLHLQKGAASGASTFLKDAPYFERLTLSVPWLTTFLEEHPKVQAQLQFVQTASLAGRGLAVFMADMRSIHQSSLGESVAKESDRVSLLFLQEKEPVFTESYWLVLPDSRMILWRYRGPMSRLVPFPGKECSKDDPEAVGGCVGRVKLPNGAWEAAH